MHYFVYLVNCISALYLLLYIQQENNRNESEENNMIIGTLENGTKCVYDLPSEIKTAEHMQSLIYGYNNGRLAESQRPELYNQPKLLSLNGPMWNGWGTLKSTGETVAIIRYEKPCKY